MKLKAVGRYLLIEMRQDSVEETTAVGIVLPKEFTEREKGGVQLATVLDVGSSAFDDQPQSVRDQVIVGCNIVTSRYPGHSINLDSKSTDEDANRFRVIADDEVHLIESEEGHDVRT
jgi:co-chaperonin GroES (HSP10)